MKEPNKDKRNGGKKIIILTIFLILTSGESACANDGDNGNMVLNIQLTVQ